LDLRGKLIVPARDSICQRGGRAWNTNLPVTAHLPQIGRLDSCGRDAAQKRARTTLCPRTRLESGTLLW